MNYEEKYKEIVGQLKKAYLYAQTDSTKAVLEEILPELKESEDERIRKEIIEAFKTLGDGKIPVVINYADIFTWLEKQSSNVDNANKEYWRGYREGRQEIFDKYAELEKQGEQKSWNEEDKRMFDYALDMIEWYGGKNEKRVRLVSDWLKSLKQRIGE
jgi:hypothetical protein